MDNITKNITGVREVLEKKPSEESYYDIRQYKVSDSGEYVKREFPKKEIPTNKAITKSNGNELDMIAHKNYCKKFQLSNVERMQLITDDENSYKDKPQLVEKYLTLMQDFKDAEDWEKFNKCTDIRQTNNLDKLEEIRKIIFANLIEFIEKSQNKNIDIVIFNKEDLLDRPYLLKLRSESLDVNYPAVYLKLTSNEYVIFGKTETELPEDRKDYNRYSENFTRMFLFINDEFDEEVPYLSFTQTSVGCVNLVRKLNNLYSCINKMELIRLENKRRCDRLSSVVMNAINREEY